MGHRTNENENDLPHNTQITITPTQTITIFPTISITPTLTNTPTVTITQTPTVTLYPTTIPTITLSPTTSIESTVPEQQSTNTVTTTNSLQKYIQSILHPTTEIKTSVPSVTKQPTKPIVAPTLKPNSNEDGPIIIKTSYGPNTIKEEGLGQTSNQDNSVLQKIYNANENIDNLLSEISTENNVDQLRLIIEEQKRSQLTFQEQLNKVENRNTLLLILLGQDYKAINNLQTEIDNTQKRIVQLQQIQVNSINSLNPILLGQTINMLQDQNTVLLFYLSIKKSTSGILEKYFYKVK